MFASELHIPPWQIERLTVAQVRTAVAQFERQQAEAAK